VITAPGRYAPARRRDAAPGSAARRAGLRLGPRRTDRLGPARPGVLQRTIVGGSDLRSFDYARHGPLGFARLFAPIPLAEAQHRRHVTARFLIRRHAAEALDRRAARIVGGERQRGVVVESIEQQAQQPHAAADVLPWVLNVGYTVIARGARRQLHQSASAFRRDRARVESRLGADHRLHQRGLDAILRGELVDDVVEVVAGCARWARRGGGDYENSVDYAHFEGTAARLKSHHAPNHRGSTQAEP